MVRTAEELRSSFQSASAEAAHAFGDSTLFLESQIGAARHVEVQLAADRHGGVLALGLRDCSVQRKHQKIVEIKEIKMRPAIDDHDYDVKMRSIKRFFEDGDKVKVTLRFRGREMAHQQLGMAVLQRVKGDLETIAKVEAEPRLEGRQMVMVLAPK